MKRQELTGKFRRAWKQDKADAVRRAWSLLIRTGVSRAKHVALALRRVFALRTTLGNADVPNLVVSPGGVGTTFVMRHLRGYIDLNDDLDVDRLKHIPHAPRDFLASKRILFIAGSDAVIYASIRRRGWVSIQGAKLGSLLVPLSAGALQRYAFRAAVRRQIARFRSYPPDAVLIVNYDDIWDNIENIQAFFGIEDPDFVATFPARRARNPKPDSPPLQS